MIQPGIALGGHAGTGIHLPDDHDRRRHGILYETAVQCTDAADFLGFASGVMIAASIWTVCSFPRLRRPRRTASRAGSPLRAATSLVLIARFALDGLMPHLHSGARRRPKVCRPPFDRTTHACPRE